MEWEPLHADNHVLAFEKPGGIPVVPDSSGDESLLDIAKSWVKVTAQKPGKVFLGVVHRLDRPVSGVVVFGRTSKGAARLSDAWRRGDVQKEYLGLVEGALPQSQGEVRQWLWKDRTKNRVHVASANREGAKEAVTRYRVLWESAGRSLVSLEPVTGRAHQLRVAMASLGTPLQGDLKYSAQDARADGMIALHAARLEFPHPTLGERVSITAAPPMWAQR
ncbi:MAG: RluA family pseudouridine synthase [Planctomycetes bacterium]|nr:RluA family pseudouridine synthase [Planctomycetota bacterium]